MSILSRELRRRSPVRVAAAVLGVAWVAMIIAFAFAATSVTPDWKSIGAAAEALGIAGAAFLYAWREPGR
jgi:peptidoglycan/LPS O-acetylase OafA/YrhL